MCATRLLFPIALCTISTGCSVSSELARKTVEQMQYHDSANELLIGIRNRRFATAAWKHYQETDSDHRFSNHYERGFKQGFADYLDGGSGEPPVVPPREYWKVSYQNSQGHQDIEDWFNGYRTGAIAAEQSGCRQWLTIPTSLPQSKPTWQSRLPAAPGTGPDSISTPEPAPAEKAPCPASDKDEASAANGPAPGSEVNAEAEPSAEHEETTRAGQWHRVRE